MDDLVRQAMAKWPNVPDCHGWLGLNARGDWYMRDDRAQAVGPFAGPGSSAASRGSLLRHDKLIAFIQRNYAADAQGRWFFQNGPQRVFVELELAPWILRVADTVQQFTVHTHTGQPVQVLRTLCDEQGRLLLHTDAGLGLVHTLDTLQAAEALEQGVWPALEQVQSADLPARFGFVPSPQAQAAASAT